MKWASWPSLESTRDVGAGGQGFGHLEGVLDGANVDSVGGGVDGDVLSGDVAVVDAALLALECVHHAEGVFHVVVGDGSEQGDVIPLVADVGLCHCLDGVADLGWRE
jgi:hypothetical protein